MTLPNLKELQAILKLCRKQGVTDITLGEMTIKFGELPREQSNDTEEGETFDGVPLPMGITAEQMAFYSSQPDPLAMREGAEQ